MKNRFYPVVKIVNLTCLFLSVSCGKIERYSQSPEIGSFQQGIQASSAIGYCAAVVVSAHEGRTHLTGLPYCRILRQEIHRW
jgi:hypothetical protein